MFEFDELKEQSKELEKELKLTKQENAKINELNIKIRKKIRILKSEKSEDKKLNIKDDIELLEIKKDSIINKSEANPDNFWRTNKNGTKTFLIDKYGDYLIEKHNINKYKKITYFNKNNKMENDQDLLQTIIQNEYKTLKTPDINEIIRYITRILYEGKGIGGKKIATPTQIISFKDGKPIISPRKDKSFFFETFPFEYKPEAEGKEIDKWLNEFTSNDEELKEQILEALSLGMIRDKVFKKGFMLWSKPDSGKTVLANIVNNIWPEHLRSSIKPTDMEGDFKNIDMINKLLNFYDDVPQQRWENPDIIKNVVSGISQLQVNPKFEKPFKTVLNAHQFYTINNLPNTNDKSGAITTRFNIIRIEYCVPKSKRTHTIYKKTTTQESLEYFFKLLIERLAKTIQADKLIETKSSKEANEKWLNNIDVVKGFAFSKFLNHPDVINKKLKEVYNYFKTTYPYEDEEVDYEQTRYIIKRDFNNRFSNWIEQNEDYELVIKEGYKVLVKKEKEV